MTANVEQGTENFKRRLDELHKWQEEQQKKINERQKEQRKKLDVEQKELYNQLGIFPLDEDGNDNDVNIKDMQYADSEDIPKKKFLKRGEGIRNRFKIDPEALRIHNLPKYKYAITHKTARKPLRPIQSKKTIHNKKKFDSKAKSNLAVNITKNDNENEKDEIDSICESYSANEEFKYLNLSSQQETSFVENIFEADQKNNNGEVNSSEKNCNLSQNESNTSVYPNKDKSAEAENISMFEFLEQKTQQGSFDIDASLIQKWIKEKASALIKTSGVTNNLNQMPSKHINIIQKLSQIKDQSQSNEESDSSFDSDAQSTDAECHNRNQEKVRVHFCEDVEVNQEKSDEENSPPKSFYQWQKTSAKTSKELDDNSDFEKFKANLFNDTENNEGSYLNDTTLVQQLLAIPLKNLDQRKEILSKTDLLKKRLMELEREILTFRNNNSELTRLRQEHEVEKLKLQQDRIEMQENFEDQKIKYEIHLHDQRLKIEEEKKKLEKLMRDQKIPNRKERDEILKLKEENESLQIELKNRDAKHIAAQARMRAQIRTLEKEVKELTFEIDILKKENKKIESENARMTRQNNNKMLQEINKTIAKLAVKPVEVPVTSDIVTNKNNKPVVARVISHKNRRMARNQDVKALSRNEKLPSSDENSDEEKYFSSSSSEENGQTRSKNNKNSHLKRNVKKYREESPNLSKTAKNQNNSYDAQEFKREIENADGSKDIWYPNGNLKKISADGMNIKMLYFNKDIKETNINEGTVRYYYAEKNTWHTTYLDGLEILEFPNGQTEHRHKDGKIEVHFPNGSIRISNSSDQHKLEEWRYADGTNCVQLRNGDKVLTFANGQKEIHTKIHKRREYPDGTVKIVYPDGSQETRYSNGRIRLKDKDGTLIMDSEINKY